MSSRRSPSPPAHGRRDRSRSHDRRPAREAERRDNREGRNDRRDEERRHTEGGGRGRDQPQRRSPERSGRGESGRNQRDHAPDDRRASDRGGGDRGGGDRGNRNQQDSERGPRQQQRDSRREERRDDEPQGEGPWAALFKPDSAEGFTYGKKDEQQGKKPAPREDLANINYELSGALAKEANTVRGVELKVTEPPEARKPTQHWRFYVFKGEEMVDTYHIHRQSAYLVGRERKVVDVPVDHPSCSKQHAVLQYRQISYEDDNGRKRKEVRPYIMDLESTNGTFVNQTKIEPRRYYELREQDVVKFGNSTREFVLLHEGSAGAPDKLEPMTEEEILAHMAAAPPTKHIEGL